MNTLIYVTSLMLTWSTNAFAGDSGKETGNISWDIFFIILSGIIGYVVGAVKSFREEKQKAYADIIPPILKMTYNPQDTIDEKEYSKALSKLWLYGSKNVTRKMEKALAIMHDHSKGDVTRALQEAVIEMRKDIQVFSYQNLRPEDVNHLYSRIAGGEINIDKFISLREIRSVVENAPPSLTAKELEEKLKSDPNFCNSLTSRFVRLFGLRNELIPFIEPVFVDLIDKRLAPLYIIENGSYTFRTDKIAEFADVAFNAKTLIAIAEVKLTQEYRAWSK